MGTPRSAGAPLEGLREFLLVDKDLALETVDQRRRWASYMTRTGFDWNLFGSGPEAALLEGRRWLAWKKTNSGKSTLHNYQLVLNDVCEWHGYDTVKFQHTKPGYGHPDPYSEAELRALQNYRQKNEFTEKRRRAMLWLCLNTGLRRSEIARARQEDLQQDPGILRVKKPAKDGKPRSIPLPPETWSSKRPLVAWLRIRATVAGLSHEGPLWIGRAGGTFTARMLTKEFDDISHELGFRVSFNRFRRTRATSLARAGVDLATLQVLYGHSDPKSTRHYYEPTVEDLRTHLERAKIPGFIRQRKKPLPVPSASECAPRPEEETSVQVVALSG